MRVLPVALLILSALVARADALQLKLTSPASVITISYDPTQPGTYLLMVVVGKDGKATVLPLPIDYELTTPSPPPPPPPDPGNLTERGKAVKKAADEVAADPKRAETAEALADLYREIKGQVGTDLKGTDAIAAALKLATDTLLNQRKVAAQWQPVRDVISGQWAKVAEIGGSDGDYAALLGEVADGLDAAKGK